MMYVISKATNKVIGVIENASDQLPGVIFSEVPPDGYAYEFEKEYISRQVEGHILRHYTQTKQSSDTADKMYFETTLKASGSYPDLEAKVTQAVADFYTAQAAGTPKIPAELAAPLAVAAGDEAALEQLIKVGIRIKWVQDCKAAYREAVAAIEAGQVAQIQLPAYPLA